MIRTAQPQQRYRWRGNRVSVPVAITSLLDDAGNMLYITASAEPVGGGDPVAIDYQVTGRTLTVEEVEGGPYILTIERELPFTQLVDLSASQNRRNLKLIEEMVDRLTLLLHQVASPTERALTVSAIDTEPSTLPPVGARAGRLVAFDSGGDVITPLGTVGQAVADWLDVDGWDDFTVAATPERRMRRGSAGEGALADVSAAGIQANDVTATGRLKVAGDLAVNDIAAEYVTGYFGRMTKLLQAYVDTYGGLYENWTSRTTNDNSWNTIAWSPELGLFAAVAYSGTGNRVMTSPDGINWTIRTSAADNNWQDIAWSPELGLFATVSTSGTGNRVMTSDDGITWTTRTPAADNQWRGIAWSPELGLFAAVSSSGSGNRVMTSPDGINWTTRTPAADNAWYGIAWSPELGLFAAVALSGTGNRVMTSPDGINWTSRTTAVDNSWMAIAWSPELGLFAAVSSTGSGNRVMTSPDGINWTSRTSADHDWRGIAWSPELGLFAAVSRTVTSNRVMTSPDGINWTLHTSAAGNEWKDIAWSPELGLFAAVSTTGTGNRVMTSESYK